MSDTRSTPAVRTRAVQRYHDGDAIEEIADEAHVTSTSVLAWVRKAAAESGESPRRQGHRRRARRTDIPPGLVRWLYDEAGLSHVLIARLTRMTSSGEHQRYLAEIARDEMATAADVGQWLGERRPALLLATLKYVATIATAVTVDGKRSS